MICLQELEIVFGHTDERTDHFVTPEAYLTTFILLLAKFFDSLQFQFDLRGQTPSAPAPGPQGVRGDSKCIFVTPKTYLTTFVSEIF